MTSASVYADPGSQFLGCPYHTGKSLTYVCEDCSSTQQPLACTECVTTIHKGHYLDLLATRVIERKGTLLKHIEFLEDVCGHIDDEEEQITLKIFQNEQETKSVLAAININENENNRLIDEITEGKVARCLATRKHNVDILLRYRSQIQSQKTNVDSYLSKCKSTCTQGSDIEVLKMRSDTSLPALPVSPKLSSLALKTCTDGNDQIKLLCGHLSIKGVDDMLERAMPTTVKETPQLQHKIKKGGIHLKLKSKAACESVPHGLRASPNGSFWIRSEDKRSIRRLSESGWVLHSLDCLVTITDLCVCPVTGRAWISGEDHSIREAMLPHTIVLRFFVKQLPTAICVTRKETLIVGTKDDIKMYTMKGELMHTYQRESSFFLSAKPLHPVKIVESSSLSLAVLCINQSSKPEDKTVVRAFNEQLKPTSITVLDRITLTEDPMDMCIIDNVVFVVYKIHGVIMWNTEDPLKSRSGLKSKQGIVSIDRYGHDSIAIGTREEIRMYSLTVLNNS